MSSTQADPHHGGDVDPAEPKDRWTGVEEALARLAHQSASDAPNPQTRPESADISAGPRIAEPSAETTVPTADVANDPFGRDNRLLGKRTAAPLARLLIAVCIGAAGVFAWRSYGGDAREMIANWAPQFGWISAQPSTRQPPDHAPAAEAAPTVAVEATAPPTPAQVAPVAQPATSTVAPSEPAAGSADRRQIETMARDLAALRQSVDQLAAAQEQLKGEIAKLQAEKRPPRRAAAPPPVAAPAHRTAMPPPMLPMPISPQQTAPQASTVGTPPRAPQSPSDPAIPPPTRPPMPVPEP